MQKSLFLRNIIVGHASALIVTAFTYLMFDVRVISVWAIMLVLFGSMGGLVLQYFLERSKEAT